MFKRFSSALLVALAIATPAQANQLKNYIYSNKVLDIVYKSGTKIIFKDESCNKNILGSYNKRTDKMVLCLENHSGYAQLADTIRHETVHIMQACLGRPIMSFQQVAKLAEPKDYNFMGGYNNVQHHHELEANIGARGLTDLEVVQFFKQSCLTPQSSS